jgi:transposase
VINEEEFMDIRALQRQGFTYAEIGRLVGRDWRTVKRYLRDGAQPVYQRKRPPSKLDPLKPLVDQWLAREPRLLATRIHQHPRARLRLRWQLPDRAPLRRALAPATAA